MFTIYTTSTVYTVHRALYLYMFFCYGLTEFKRFLFQQTYLVLVLLQIYAICMYCIFAVQHYQNSSI